MPKKQVKTASLAASPSKKNSSLSVFVNYVHKKYKAAGNESPKSTRNNSSNRVKVTYGKSCKSNRNLTSILNGYSQDVNLLAKTADSKDSGIKLLSSDDDDEEYQSALDIVNNDNKEQHQANEEKEKSDCESDSDYKEGQSEEEEEESEEDEEPEDNRNITNKLRLKENGNKDLKSINQEILKLQQEQEASLQKSKQEKAVTVKNEKQHITNIEAITKKPLTTSNINQQQNGTAAKLNSNGKHITKSTNNNKDYLYGQNLKYSNSDFYQIEENSKDFGSSKTTHKILKNWTSKYVLLKPCGLLNHGVTCYTNAAVQAMIHIPAVQHFLDDINNGKVPEVAKDSVSSIFAQTSKKMWYVNNHNNSKVKYINPKRLIKELDNINCMMSVWQQEDSHEYYMSLLSKLQEDSTPKGKKLNTSIIYDIFGGLLDQEIQCQNCQNISTTKQEFYDLSLSLDPKKKREVSVDEFNNSSEDDLQQDSSNSESTEKDGDNNSFKRNAKYSVINAIKDFFEPELIKKISKSNGYECSNCNKISNALKLTSIEKAPETLTIHIKRFRFDENSSHSSKLKSKVSFPCILDLPDFRAHKQTEETDPIRYQLISVVVHEGRSVSSGHYIAHCRQPNGEWNTYDDEYVNKISEADVLNETNAYYLVYTRLKFKKSNGKKRSLSPDENHVSKKRR